jgi:hemerythrin
MSFIDLRAEYKVYIRSIDFEHEVIASLANSIHEYVLNNDRSSISSGLNKLLEVFENHFENEERLMKENKYPGYFTHKLEHDRFYNQFLKTIHKFEKEEEPLDSNELLGLRRWFFNHIDINDRKCGQYLIDKGIS